MGMGMGNAGGIECRGAIAALLAVLSGGTRRRNCRPLFGQKAEVGPLVLHVVAHSLHPAVVVGVVGLERSRLRWRQNTPGKEAKGVESGGKRKAEKITQNSGKFHECENADEVGGGWRQYPWKEGIY